MSPIVVFILALLGFGATAWITYRMDTGWKRAHDRLFRERFQLRPRRRLLPHLRLPQLRLRR